MTKEELVYDFANRQFHKAPINTARDLMCMCSDFANEFLAQPLSSRLTAEEKERVRKIHRDYHQKWDCSCNDRESERSFYCFSLLERIFGADFFKEEE